MDPIKEAFARAKQDIIELKEQITSISKEIEQLKILLHQNLSQNRLQQTDTLNIQTDRQTNPADNSSFKDLKSPNSEVSSGNEGVPTDRQTDQQTDRHIRQSSLNSIKPNNLDKISKIEQVSVILDSLDSIKKDLRSKFKKLTNQEMLVFSTIYQLEEENIHVDYTIISQKLSLSESSIRDYVQKIIKKGIPLVKYKENNKKVLISIPQELRKIASLHAILALREL